MLSLKRLLLLTLVFLVVFQTGETRPQNDDDDSFTNDEGNEDYDMDEDPDTDDIEDEDTEAIQISSKPLNLEVREGSVVFLPCDVSNRKAVVTMWKKGDQLLSQDTLSLDSSGRIQPYGNNTLQLKNVSRSDEGTYKCEILGDRKDSLEHTLSVLYHAEIDFVSPKDGIQIEKGKSLTLMCNATGKPTPTITWSKQGSRLHNKESFSGGSITIENVTRENAGVYQCMADNKIGDPSHYAIEVKVLFSPVVKIEKVTVNTAEGYDSELECIVHAEPPATVVWQKGSKNIVDAERVAITHDKFRHMLKILQTRRDDFDDYTCLATNSLGRTKKHITLSGNPLVSDVVQGSVADDRKSPVLEFNVESNSPVTEYELRYRKYAANDWITMKPEVQNAVMNNIYVVRHPIEGLEPGKYIAQLKAKNTYGWSPYSKQFEFEGDYENRVGEHKHDFSRAPDTSSASTTDSSLLIATVAVLLACKYV